MFPSVSSCHITCRQKTFSNYFFNKSASLRAIRNGTRCNRHSDRHACASRAGCIFALNHLLRVPASVSHRVLPPHVTESRHACTNHQPRKIRFGMGSSRDIPQTPASPPAAKAAMRHFSRPHGQGTRLPMANSAKYPENRIRAFSQWTCITALTDAGPEARAVIRRLETPYYAVQNPSCPTEKMLGTRQTFSILPAGEH